MDSNTKVDEQLIYEVAAFQTPSFPSEWTLKVWEYVERPPGNRGGVDIIPIIKYKDKPSQVIVIANFRPPIRKFCLEFPAGIVDPEGSIQENGLREIKEETGYTAQIGQYQYNGVRIRNDPWKSTEHGLCVIVDVDGDSEVNINPKQHLESDENIIVYKVSMGKTMTDEILQLAKEKNYEIAGLLWFLLWDNNLTINEYVLILVFIFMLFLSLFIGNCLASLNLTIGIDITNKESLAYLGRLEQHYEQFEEKGLILNIVNHILPCYTCQQRHNYTQPEPNCFGGGRYCQFSPFANGQLLLTEIIRQNCLYTTNIYIYLSYINLFSQDCLENPHYTFCSENILKNIINYNITELDECINASFKGVGDKALLENYILSKEMNKQYNQSFLNVFLDNKDITYQPFNDMIVQLCQKLHNDPPEYCNIYSVTNKSFYLFIVMLILLILISIRMLKKANYVILNKASIPIEETIGIISEENVQ